MAVKQIEPSKKEEAGVLHPVRMPELTGLEDLQGPIYINTQKKVSTVSKSLTTLSEFSQGIRDLHKLLLRDEAYREEKRNLLNRSEQTNVRIRKELALGERRNRRDNKRAMVQGHTFFDQQVFPGVETLSPNGTIAIITPTPELQEIRSVLHLLSGRVIEKIMASTHVSIETFQFIDTILRGSFKHRKVDLTTCSSHTLLEVCTLLGFCDDPQDEKKRILVAKAFKNNKILSSQAAFYVYRSIFEKKYGKLVFETARVLRRMDNMLKIHCPGLDCIQFVEDLDFIKQHAEEIFLLESPVIKAKEALQVDQPLKLSDFGD